MHSAHLGDRGGTGEDGVRNLELFVEPDIVVTRERQNRASVILRSSYEKLLDTCSGVVTQEMSKKPCIIIDRYEQFHGLAAAQALDEG
jgi:hypothetical protein